MGSMNPRAAQELAATLADVMEPMLLQFRQDQEKRQEAFLAGLGGIISSMVRAEAAELFARTGPRQLSSVHSYVPGMAFMAGVLVSHRGGLWQAADNTQGEPGTCPDWRLLANGVADVTGFIDEDDPRLLTLAMQHSSGDVVNLEVRLPLPLHRGKFDPQAQYQQGDEVAWEGSTWRARGTCKGAQPPGPDWLLVSKAGERGRAGGRQP